MQFEEEFDELMEKAAELDYCRLKYELLQQAVDLAETHQEEEYAYDARMELVGAANFAGRPDIAIVTFSWLLAKSDANPDQYNPSNLLWKYKWILGESIQFPNISLQQIEDLFADMKRRFLSDGSTLHAYHGIRRDNAVSMGDLDTALAENEIYRDLDKDHLSNCPACIPDADIDFYTFIGDDKMAIESALPILKGKLSCAEVPQRTYGYLQLPLLRLGRIDEAVKHFKKGYRMIRGKPKFLRQAGLYIQMLTLTDNLDRATRILDQHFGDAIDTVSPMWKFEFYLPVRLLVHRLVEKNQQTLPIRIPKAIAEELGEDVETTALAQWLDQQLTELALAFDTRNGNTNFQKRYRSYPELFQFAKPFKINN